MPRRSAGERWREDGQHAGPRFALLDLPRLGLFGDPRQGVGSGAFARDLRRPSGPTRLTYREITAQDDRVSVVADSTMPLKSGGSYDQTYHWLFKFRDDKIFEILEYLDILAVWKTFGTPDQKAIAKAATEAKANAG
jgi:hypothetical protein